MGASSLYNIEDAMFHLPEKSLIVIEDIDNCSATKRRSEKKEPKSGESKPSIVRDENPSLEAIDNDMGFDYMAVNLSDLLNTIDGIHHIHGRILIATTNYIERLDDALIRDGRFDLKIKIDFVDDHIFKNVFNNFYPDHNVPKDFEIRNGVNVAYIQNLVLKNLNAPETVLEDLREV